MTELEQLQLKEYKKYLRLSSERDLYTIPQAAFRLNCSRNNFKSKYVETGKIKLVFDDGKLMVPATELPYAISELPKVVYTNSLRAVISK